MFPIFNSKADWQIQLICLFCMTWLYFKSFFKCLYSQLILSTKLFAALISFFAISNKIFSIKLDSLRLD